MAYQKIRYETNAPLALIVIDREAEQNRLDGVTIAELTEAFEQTSRDDSIRVVILTGSGEFFSAGVAIEEIDVLDPEAGKRYAERGQALMRFIEGLGKPTIAAINGTASGAGLELALACSLRIASDNAMLSQTEVRLGLFPGFGGVRRLARLVGVGRALELLLTCEPIGAEEACRMGLVNRVAGKMDLFRAAKELAQRVSNNAPLAIKYCLESLFNGLEMPLEDALFLDSTLFGLCCATEDKREGTRAFLEKRPPIFRGK